MRATLRRVSMSAVTAMALVALVGGCGSATQGESGGSGSTTGGQTGGQGSAGSASGESAADFYKGKILQFIVPYGPGGGYDQWARLIAPYLQKYLGVRQVQVENVPGGGGLVGTNQIYAAKPDGLTIGDTNAGGDVFDQIVGASGMNFDVTKMTWLARPDDDPHIMAVHPGGKYTSFEDLEHAKEPVQALATGKGSSDYNAAVVTFNAFKIPFKMVAAFSGSSDEKAAFLRGNGDTSSLSASDIAEIGNQAKVVILESGQSFDKLPNVPTVIQLAKQAGLSENTINALNSMVNIMDLGHAFIAPPGVPADRIKALDDAISKSLQDPKFVAAAKRANLYIGYLPASKVTQMVSQSMKTASELKPLLNDNS
ncbi:Bug family tripartite tricarboxylate transporter substrate binding protein [Alicyclobacillus suci]|uniref:Bug family tripartite tricarboxylate transporter substrate binding protein n=1 Tax=Alicyclobacillus suci TaxID=2816080 RepID=UPI001A8E437F|nr:tripartite tricarboxylate transporter substrate-binding protein [Alicyclobacillus suci]